MSTEPLLNRPCGGNFENVLEAIGNTPMVELPRLTPKPEARMWAKLEGRNPTGSVKDRVAKFMIDDAEERGAIERGHTILEPTSGNTGISLGMICSRKGYPLKVVMPDNVTHERTQLLQMYGAEIVYSSGEQGSNGAVAKALEMAEADASYYMPYQYGNAANPQAHYDGTAPPIIDLSLLDRKIFVTNHDAVVWTRKLLDEEGIFAGVSSGAIASIAVRIARELDEGNVVFIVCDDGWTYLSSGVYTLPVEEIENLDSTVWW